MQPSKFLCLDPAGGSFGVALLELDNGLIQIPMHFLLNSPAQWSMTKKNNYMAYSVAALIGIEKPDVVISEKPFGIGFSAQALKELIGAIKAESWADIKWQGISEVRRGVLGDGYGGADKVKSSEWLLQYPFSRSAKNIIELELDNAKNSDKIGYDILDAILHGTYYLVDNGLISPVHKPAKDVKKKKKSIINET